MTTFSGGFLIPDRFESSSATIFFYRTNSYLSVTPITMPIQNTQQARSIVLSNGARYDPFQTYDAPQTPGQFTASSNLLPKPGLSDIAKPYVESAIGSWFDSASSYVGMRATFTAYSAYGVAFTCTARLIGVNLEPFHNFPKQIPTGMGGDGQLTPGMSGARMTCTFDQITNWTD